MEKRNTYKKKKGFLGFFCNSENNRHHGTGIVIRENLDPTFTRVSPRVCSASFTNKNTHFLFVSGYAPHESLSNKCPEIRNLFYEDLQKALLQKKSNTVTVIALDANAQTSYNADLPKVIGHFTKGNKTNNNGHHLISFAAKKQSFSYKHIISTQNVSQINLDCPIQTTKNERTHQEKSHKEPN